MSAEPCTPVFANFQNEVFHPESGAGLRKQICGENI